MLRGLLVAAGVLLAAPVWSQPAAPMPERVPDQVPVADLLAPSDLAALPAQVADPDLASRLGAAGLAYPLAQPALAIDPWGWRYSDSRAAWRMHTGVDFAAPSGTPVLAALAGEVILAAETSGYGLTVILDHGGGVQTLYAHLQEIGVAVGARLEQGDRLGLLGMTGRATGPHLHFELRSRGSSVVAHDPIPYLPPLLPPPSLTASRP